MGKGKKTRAAAVKKIISAKDSRLPSQQLVLKKKAKEEEEKPRHVDQTPSALWFKYNTALGPPYHVLVDTNFINFSIRNKLEIFLHDGLPRQMYTMHHRLCHGRARKPGQKYRVALRLAKDPRFQRLPCTHKGTYADDCIFHRAQQHRCYIVATCDTDLRKRIRQISGVPIMYIQPENIPLKECQKPLAPQGERDPRMSGTCILDS